MSEKTLEIVRKGNSNTLLTVTPDRITIKLKDGLSGSEESEACVFLGSVAAALVGEPHSMRGTLQSWGIKMKSNGGRVTRTFLIDDIVAAA